MSEKKSIGREIHDGLAQSLTIACLKLDLLVMQMPKKSSKELKEISKLLRGTLSETRNLMHRLDREPLARVNRRKTKMPPKRRK